MVKVVLFYVKSSYRHKKWFVMDCYVKTAAWCDLLSRKFPFTVIVNKCHTIFICVHSMYIWIQLYQNVIFMLFQVLSLHSDASWLHIGCDEVYQIGQCPICSQKILSANRDPNNNGQYQDGKTLFLQHVSRVGKYVR